MCYRLSKVIGISLIFLCLSIPITTYAAFQDMFGWSSRAMGMGGSYVAVADDADSVVWNPAGLGLVKNIQLSAMYVKPYLNLPWDVNLGLMSASGVYPYPDIGGTLGAGITDYDAGGLYRENIFTGAYATKVYYDPKGTSAYAGVAVKYLSHQYGWDSNTKSNPDAQSLVKNNSKSAITADIGVLANVTRELNVGAVVRNVTQPNVALGTGVDDKVPMEVAAGLGYRLSYETLVSAELVYRQQDWGEQTQKMHYHAGVEYTMKGSNIVVRAGYDSKRGATAGASYFLGGGMPIRIDYALLWSLTLPDNQGTHRVSLNLGFGEPPAPKPRVTGRANPPQFSPNSDGDKDTVKFELQGVTTGQQITQWEVAVNKSGVPVRTLMGTGSFPPSFIWNGKNDTNELVPEGDYQVNVSITLNGDKETLPPFIVTVDLTPPQAELTLSASVFSPNGDGADDTVLISAGATDEVGVGSWKLKITDTKNKVVKSKQGDGVPPQEEWDGTDDYYNRVVPDGRYTCQLLVADAAGNKKSVSAKVSVKSGMKVTEDMLKKAVKDAVKESIPGAPKGATTKKIPGGLKVTLSSINLYDKGKGSLKSTASGSLDETVKLLEQYPDSKIQIEAHTDSVGEDSANELLTEVRAKSVSDYFVDKGIDPKRIRAKGYGETKPVAPNTTASGRTMNQRVDIIILGTE